MSGQVGNILLLWMGLPLTAFAQLAGPLADVPHGAVDVRLGLFASGLPVAKEFITPVFTQRVGPTDLAVIPDGNSMVVTTYGGKAFLLSAQR